MGKCAKRTEFWVSRDWATANTKQKIQIIPVRGVMFLPVNVMKEFYGWICHNLGKQGWKLLILTPTNCGMWRVACFDIQLSGGNVAWQVKLRKDETSKWVEKTNSTVISEYLEIDTSIFLYKSGIYPTLQLGGMCNQYKISWSFNSVFDHPIYFVLTLPWSTYYLSKFGD